MRAPFLVFSGICTLLAAGIFRGQAAQAPSTAPQAGTFREEVIAELPPDSEVPDLRSCGGHVAWIEKQNGMRTVNLDGKPQGSSYKEVKYLVACAQAGHLAFFGKRDSKWVLLADGKEGSEEYNTATSPAFQPKGNSLAYGACIDKHCFLYIDGKATGPEFEEISYPRYSRDGERLAYLGKNGKLWTAIVDGKEVGPKVPGFIRFGFSPTGSRFYVAAAAGSQASYVVDGTSGPDFPVIGPIDFSSDDRHFAYGGASSQSGFTKKKVFGTVIQDGSVVATYEGKGMAGNWTLMAGSIQMLVHGLRNLDPDYEGISDPHFNPDGKLVYAVRHDKGDIAVLVGGEAGPGFEDILSPVVFTDDSRHFAYIARHGKDFVEVRDNVPGRSIPAGSRGPTMVPQILLSKDASHIAFETVEGGSEFKAGHTARALRSLVIDGKEGPRYDALGIYMVDANKDFTRYFYGVLGAKGNHHLVCVNGHESRLYDDIGGLQFADDDKAAVFIARDGQRLLRVTYVFP